MNEWKKRSKRKEKGCVCEVKERYTEWMGAWKKNLARKYKI